MVDPGEECDGLDHQGLSCTDFGARGGALYCNAYCNLEHDQCYYSGWRPHSDLGSADLHAIWGSYRHHVFTVGSGGEAWLWNGYLWNPIALPNARQDRQLLR